MDIRKRNKRSSKKLKKEVKKMSENQDKVFNKTSINCLSTIYLTHKNYDRLDENLSFS